MKEVWKTIEEFPNYQISNFGRARSLNFNKTKKKRILKLSKDKDGYLRINAFNKGVRKTFRIHRLVANAFIPNLENKAQINHKDGNKHNNCISNLEWTSSHENLEHAFKAGLKCRYKILQYDLSGKLVKMWNSLREIEKTLKISRSNISLCAVGKYRQSHGYIWKFAKR